MASRLIRVTKFCPRSTLSGTACVFWHCLSIGQTEGRTMRFLPAIFTSFAVVLGLYGSGLLLSHFLPRSDGARVWVTIPNASGALIIEPASAARAAPAFTPGSTSAFTHGSKSSVSDRASVKTAETRKPEPDPLNLSQQPIDEETTASIPQAIASDTIRETAPTSSMLHVQWCAGKYRSYRADDNSYTLYNGGSRECVSPYSSAYSQPPRRERASNHWEVSVEGVSRLSARHIRSCFNRYQSYRLSDNTYQPYGGVPRRLCR